MIRKTTKPILCRVGGTHVRRVRGTIVHTQSKQSIASCMASSYFRSLLTLPAQCTQQILWNGPASVCPSVCPIDRQQQPRRAAGLLLSAPQLGRRYRSIAHDGAQQQMRAVSCWQPNTDLFYSVMITFRDGRGSIFLHPTQPTHHTSTWNAPVSF